MQKDIFIYQLVIFEQLYYTGKVIIPINLDDICNLEKFETPLKFIENKIDEFEEEIGIDKLMYGFK